MFYNILYILYNNISLIENGTSEVAMSTQKPNFTLRIIIVCGEPHVGKSSYIADTFSTKPYDVLDVYQFQVLESYPQSMASHTKYALGNMFLEVCVSDKIQEIYRQERRKFLNAIKNQEPIDNEQQEYILIIEGTLLKRARRLSLLQTIRNVTENKNNVSIDCIWVTKSNRKMHPEVEEPELSEGYSSCATICDHQLVHNIDDIQKLVAQRNAIDRIKDNKYFLLPPENLLSNKHSDLI